MLFLPDFLPPFAGSVRRHRIATIMIASRGSMEKRVWSILYVLYGYGMGYIAGHCRGKWIWI